MSSELFQRELIIDHYKNPRRKGLMAAPDGRAHDTNPFCGDEVTVDVRIENGAVVDAAFDGRGCSISQATASMLVEEMVGKPVGEIAVWDQAFVLKLLGVEIGPVRIKCALLPLTVVQEAIAQIPIADSSAIDSENTETG